MKGFLQYISGLFLTFTKPIPEAQNVTDVRVIDTLEGVFYLIEVNSSPLSHSFHQEPLHSTSASLQLLIFSAVSGGI